ncbi:hypothetical protein [Aeromonas enteropelogenes]|uniref:Uncharacterized protein n=1 Tax=Aeromonas enteropelogenes TaxID=29489 RepID=A0ABU9J6B9_AEREN
MSKGGSNEVQETEAQKALAEVAMNQWNLYKGGLQQYEDLFIDKVDDLDSQDVQDQLAGTAALGTTRSFGEARTGLADAMAANWVDPTSGKYQDTMAELETDQALSQTDTTNRAQSSQQDKYVAGLKDVTSIGQGQKAEALAGYSNLASTSLLKAVSDAESKIDEKQAALGLIGAVGGSATAYGMERAKSRKSPEKISPIASVLQNKGY